MLIHGRLFQPGITDIICDRCGESCRVIIERTSWLHWLLAGIANKPAMNYCYAHLIAQWPYGSPKDTIQEEAHICEKCWDELKITLEKEGLKITITEYPWS